MKFSLIICTYQRPAALEKLLSSVKDQSVSPQEILVIDGSPGNETKKKLGEMNFPGLKYFQVGEEDRGLTRQRNFGIKKAWDEADVVCFLDDDVVLTKDYFQKLLGTYKEFPNAMAVGGYILEEVPWTNTSERKKDDEYEIDGYSRKLGSRYFLRKRLGLLSPAPPGVMPDFSNALPIGFLPPSGKTYPVEFFMGGVASYRKEVFDEINFSSYFEGYGLYEDMDFCLRASRYGQLYVNTAAQLHHYHEEAGRPNQFKYGKMVIRNGWYVWRVKYPAPSFTARLKWHATAFLLTLVRFGNVLTTAKKKEALTESLGRMIGWWSLLYNKPRHEN